MSITNCRHGGGRLHFFRGENKESQSRTSEPVSEIVAAGNLNLIPIPKLNKSAIFIYFNFDASEFERISDSRLRIVDFAPSMDPSTTPTTWGGSSETGSVPLSVGRLVKESWWWLSLAR